jgi:hypothetical protein
MARKRIPPRTTTIQVTPETRDELKKRGKKGDTYDDIIQELFEKTK